MEKQEKNELQELKTEYDNLLKRSESKYRRLVESIQKDHFFYRHDTEGYLTYVSPSVEIILGYTPEEFLTYYTKFFTDSPINEQAKKNTELSLQGIEVPPYEIEVRKKDGTIGYQEVVDTPVFNESGKIIALEGISRDITQRKKMEEELRYRLQFERLITTIANDFLKMDTDEIDERIQAALKNLTNFIGADRSYIIGFSDTLKKHHEVLYSFSAGNTPKLSIFPKDTLFYRKIDNHQIFFLEKTGDIPSSETETLKYLKSNRIQSMVIVPVIISGKICCAMGFDSISKERNWSENTINLMKITAEIFGNAMHRKYTEELLKQSVHEKEILLKEVHHRVKNNLALVDSLMHLAGESMDTSQGKDVLRALSGRVRSIALVHEKLYKSKNLTSIDGKDYLQDLLYTMEFSSGFNRKISLTLDLDPISLPIDTVIPIGFITHELVINAYKYAFHPSLSGEITVSLKRHNSSVILRVSDNGSGMPESFSLDHPEHLGFQLVSALVNQIKGTIRHSLDSGLNTFNITFPLNPEK